MKNEDDSLLLPINIKYDGIDTDGHFIDAVYLGRSIEGTAKLYNQSIYLFDNGIVPSSKSKYRVKVYAQAPEKGSVSLGLYSFITGAELAVYPANWGKIASWLVPNLVKIVWQRIINKPDKMDKMIDFLREENERNRVFAKDMSQMSIGAIMQDKSHLYDIINQLADSNKSNAKLIAEPVGRSCSVLTHSSDGHEMFTIDEPIAEFLRSKDDVEVSDLEKFKCRIEGVSRVNGYCQVIIENVEKPIPAKITDPELLNTGNIYTNALDRGIEIIIHAKSLTKDGKIKKLFISDAEK